MHTLEDVIIIFRHCILQLKLYSTTMQNVQQQNKYSRTIKNTRIIQRMDFDILTRPDKYSYAQFSTQLRKTYKLLFRKRCFSLLSPSNRELLVSRPCICKSCILMLNGIYLHSVAVVAKKTQFVAFKLPQFLGRNLLGRLITSKLGILSSLLLCLQYRCYFQERTAKVCCINVRENNKMSKFERRKFEKSDSI